MICSEMQFFDELSNETTGSGASKAAIDGQSIRL